MFQVYRLARPAQVSEVYWYHHVYISQMATPLCLRFGRSKCHFLALENGHFWLWLLLMLLTWLIAVNTKSPVVFAFIVFVFAPIL